MGGAVPSGEPAVQNVALPNCALADSVKVERDETIHYGCGDGLGQFSFYELKPGASEATVLASGDHPIELEFIDDDAYYVRQVGTATKAPLPGIYRILRNQPGLSELLPEPAMGHDVHVLGSDADNVLIEDFFNGQTYETKLTAFSKKGQAPKPMSGPLPSGSLISMFWPLAPGKIGFLLTEGPVSNETVWQYVASLTDLAVGRVAELPNTCTRYIASQDSFLAFCRNGQKYDLSRIGYDGTISSVAAQLAYFDPFAPVELLEGERLCFADNMVAQCLNADGSVAQMLIGGYFSAGVTTKYVYYESKQGTGVILRRTPWASVSCTSCNITKVQQ